MSNFALYLLGFGILVAGLACLAALAGAPGPWIAAGALTMIGVGVIAAVKRLPPRLPR